MNFSLKRQQLFQIMVVFAGLLFCLLYWPILVTKMDFWDGCVLSYASYSLNPSIYKTIYMEAGIPLAMPLYQGLYHISNFFGVSMKIFSNTVICVSLGLCIVEIYKICRNIFGWHQVGSLLSSFAFMLWPISSMFFSSIFVYYAVMIYICLLGTRLYIKNNYLSLSVILLAIAFQLPSNPFLMVSLLSLSYLFGSRKNYFKDILVLLFLSSIFVVTRKLFPAHGIYSTYNQMKLVNLLIPQFYMKFIKFFIIYNVPIIIAMAILVLFSKGSKKYTPLYLLVLLIFNIVPYIIVGKLPPLYFPMGIANWNARYVMSCYVILAITIGYVHQSLVDFKDDRRIKHILIILLCAFFSFEIFQFITAYKQRARELVYAETFIKNFPSAFSRLEPGYVTLENNADKFRFYELNFFEYLATGNINFIFTSRDDTFVAGISEKKYRDSAVLPYFNPPCDYSLTVENNIHAISTDNLLKHLYGLQINDIQFVFEISNKGCVSKE